MSVNVYVVSMRQVGGSEVLAGAGHGRRVCAEALGAASVSREPTICLLDFVGVAVATSSFLREAVLRLRDAARAQSSPLYPVVANATDEVREELDDMLRRSGEVMPACRTSATGDFEGAEILGELDPKQRRAFDLIREAGEADAATLLANDNLSEPIGHSAWNNRLAALSAKGLVLETQHGRSKRYRLLLPGM